MKLVLRRNVHNKNEPLREQLRKLYVTVLVDGLAAVPGSVSICEVSTSGAEKSAFS